MALLQAPSPQDITNPPDSPEQQNYMAMLQQLQQSATPDAPGQGQQLPQQDPQAAQQTQQQADQERLRQQMETLLRQRSTDTEADAVQKLRARDFGLKPGQENPTTGQRLKSGALEALSTILFGGGGSPSERRRQDLVSRQFPADTQRLQVADQVFHNDAVMKMSQAKMAQMQQTIDEHIRQNKERADLERIKLKQDQERNEALNSYHRTITEIQQQKADNAGNLGQQQILNLQQDNLIKQFKNDNPGISEDMVRGKLLSGQTDPNAIISINRSLALAFHPNIVTGSVSKTDLSNGITYNDKTFVPPPAQLNIGPVPPIGGPPPSTGTPGPALGPPASPTSPDGTAPGASPMPQPAQPVAPRPPVAAPVQRPIARPQTPQTPATQFSAQDLINPRVPLPPGTFGGRTQNTKRVAEDAKMMETVHKQAEYESTANLGLDNMINAVLTGKVKDFQGALAGNPLFAHLREMFGTKSEQETFSLLENLDTLYGKLGSNIRGRFTTPEIAGHLRAMASGTATPENAVMSLAALKLQANLQQMMEQEKLKPADMPAVRALISSELRRIQSMIQPVSEKNPQGTTTEDRAIVAAGAPNPKRFAIKSIQELMQQRNQAAEQHGLSTGPTIEEVRAEVARRKKLAGKK